MSAKLRVAIVGAGYWGPNLIRNFDTHQQSEVVAVCDSDPGRRARLATAYPHLAIVDDAAGVFADPSVDAVVIATPTATHYPLARAALEAGKHVLVEKPVATTPAEAFALDALARERGRVLLVGHVFLYNLAVQRLKQIVADPEFGEVYYLHARRTNLGPVREDVHAGWDLASHDLSMLLYLKDALPVEITASAQQWIRQGVPDVVFATLYWADGTMAHLHTSWLDPQKVRELTVVGSKRMVTFDDMNLSEPIRIYQKGFRRVDDTPAHKPVVDTFGSFRVELVQGDVIIPSLSSGEPLRLECQAFLDAVRTGQRPLADGVIAARVVQLLAAMDRSIAEGSRKVAV